MTFEKGFLSYSPTPPPTPRVHEEEEKEEELLLFFGCHKKNSSSIMVEVVFIFFFFFHFLLVFWLSLLDTHPVGPLLLLFSVGVVDVVVVPDNGATTWLALLGFLVALFFIFIQFKTFVHRIIFLLALKNY